MVVSGTIKKLLSWFDQNALFLVTAFLLAFIPLYPKIPLGEIIPGYIVRIRLEDIFVAGAMALWGIQVLRRKIEWRTPVTWFVVGYAISGLLANILGVVLIHTIPAEMLHFGKSMLHWMRYLEYFSLFFLAYSAVRTRKQAMILIGVVVATVLAVAVYGYGQKYHYWPVYSTMNREFSKGMKLVLGDFARVQSTFAGHYDLGAYLVVVLPLMLALMFTLKRPWAGEGAKRGLTFVRKLFRLATIVAWISGLWLLALSASRTSFIGYLLAAGVVVLMYGWKKSGWKRWIWLGTRGALVLGLSVVIMFAVGELPSRFAQIIDQNKHPQLHKTFHAVNDLITHPYKLIGMQPSRPDNTVSVDELEKDLNDQGLTVSDTQPIPSDVYVNTPNKEFELDDPNATLAANLTRVGDKLIEERVYSQCALERSLSLCIRLETLWPRAIHGFVRNPIFGSGYATLTKETVTQFTEAESTDNNFLRTLGETGLAGFFFFYGTVGLIMWYGFKYWQKGKDRWLVTLSIASIAGGMGLLLNAMYIDVFAASKVAYSFWALQGVILAVLVSEGNVAPKFNFLAQKKAEQSSMLMTLLRSAEEKQQSRTVGDKTYLSSHKRRVRSTKRTKSVHKK